MSFLDGLRHHLSVAREAYREERALKHPKGADSRRRRQEFAFLPAALEVTETPASPLGRTMMMAICAIFVIAVAWSIIGRIDIFAVAQGKIIPSERVKVVQPLETGVVRAIRVVDGQQVAAGDVLIELDPTGSRADVERLGQDLTAARVELARLAALLQPDPEAAYAPPAGAPAAMVALHRSYLLSELQQQRSHRRGQESEIRRRQAELRTIEASIDRYENKLAKVTERRDASRKLYDKGFLPRLRFSELEQELGEVEGQLEVERRRLVETEAALTSARARLAETEAEFRRQSHAGIAEARQREASIEQELIKAAERNRLQTLTAPVAGTVQQLAVHTIGGVVTPAQPLMQIVPAGAELEIEAMVLNRDIGFVREGQAATLKIESFPFTKYGTIDGRVRQIYKDAVEREGLGLAYPARVTMARTTMNVDGRTVQLTPGMAVTVEIKTGKRRVIDYILAPLKRYQDESLREQ